MGSLDSRDHLSPRSLPHSVLESLIGKLNFPQTPTLNRFARGMMKPLHGHLYQRPYSSALSRSVRRNSIWWGATLSVLPSRVIGPRQAWPDFILFADASYQDAPLSATMAAILFDRSEISESLEADALLTRGAIPVRLRMFHRYVAHFRF